MAILGPEQLPGIMRLRSDPIKFEVLSQLGHPVVLVELTEAQLEQAIRVTGDFVAQYFPTEERVAYFTTQPLVSVYDIPADAYWIRDVKWDPATTRIGDIFGAESFLFCYSGGTKILSDKGSVISEELYKRDYKRIVTPFGIRKPRMRWNKKKQDVVILQTKNDFLICTPNHPVSCNERMIPACNCELGDKLISSKDKQVEIIGKEKSTTDGTWSIQSPNGGLYVSSLGREFYLSH